MEILFGFIFELLAEFFLSIFGEAIAELGLNSFFQRSGKIWSRSITAIFYIVLGVALGAMSLWLLPLMLFGNRTLPIIFFVVSPIFAGLGLCLANWIIRRGIDDQNFFQLSKFIYGALFALTFSLTRSMLG
jgi:hypothetical protein